MTTNRNLGVKHVEYEEYVRPQLPVELDEFLKFLASKIIIRGLAYKSVITRLLLEMYFKDKSFQELVEKHYDEYKEYAYKRKEKRVFVVRISKKMRGEIDKIRRLKKRYIMDLIGACVYVLMKYPELQQKVIDMINKGKIFY